MNLFTYFQLRYFAHSLRKTEDCSNFIWIATKISIDKHYAANQTYYRNQSFGNSDKQKAREWRW